MEGIFPESGTFYIRHVASRKLLNLIFRESDKKPMACICNVTESAAQRWELKSLPHHGDSNFSIRNAVTGLYLAHDQAADLQVKSNNVFGRSEDAFPWRLTQLGEHLYITCSKGGTQLFLGDSVPDSTATTQRIETAIGASKMDSRRVTEPRQNFMWKFEQIDENMPPPYFNNPYIGPVPPGIYWIRQSDGNLSPAGPEQSMAGITVTARLPLIGEKPAPVHLGAIWKAPWPNQIWILEPGVHGYRLRNLGTDTCLTYHKSEPKVQPTASGMTSSSEWNLTEVPKQGKDTEHRISFTISPLADLNYILTSMVNTDTLNKLGVSPRSRPFWDLKSPGYTEWCFEAVDKELLAYPALLGQ